MEKDRLNIDRLFRENLSSREVPPSDSDWAEIEKSLNASKGIGRSRWFWGIGSILVLGVAALVAYCSLATNQPHNSENISVQSQQPNFEESNEISGHRSSSGNAKTENSDVDSSNVFAFNAGSNPNAPSGEGSQLIQTSTSNENNGTSNKNSHSAQSEHAPSNDQSVSNNSGKINSRLKAKPNRSKINKPQSIQNASSEALANSTNNTNTPDDANGDSKSITVFADNKDQSGANPSKDNIKPDGALLSTPLASIADRKLPMTSLQSRHPLFSRQEDSMALSKPMLDNPGSTLTNWTTNLSWYGLKSNSHIEEQNDDLQKRNEEELPAFQWGILLDAQYKFERSQIGLGLGYEKFGEDIQYTDEITRQFTYTTSEIQYFQQIVILTDSSFIDGQWVFDTTQVITLDSTYINVEHIKDSLVHDPSLVQHNGISVLQQIIVPVSYRFDLFQFNESAEIFLSGGVQLDYAMKRRAYYLESESKSLLDINEMKSYRTINTSAYLGVGMRYHVTKHWLASAEILGRRNLFSWNDNFIHRYTSYGLRLGIGYNF